MTVLSHLNDVKFREFKMRNQDDLAKKIEKAAKQNNSKEKDEHSSTKADEDVIDSQKVSFNVI